MAVEIVLVHAFPLDSRLFGQLGELPGNLLTPNLPGFGGREPARGTPGLDAFADAIIGDLDRAGIDRAVIGGVSLGGYVALNVVSRYPSRVLGLVLADTKAAADTDQARDSRLKMAAAADLGKQPGAADLIWPLVSDFTHAQNPDVVALLTRIAGDQPSSTIAWAQRAMATRPDRLSDLAATEIPVLVLVGENDAVTGIGFAQEMAAAASDSRLVILPDVGHLTPAEDPAGFTSELAAWLEENFVENSGGTS